MELVKSISKLSPEERRRELRKAMFRVMGEMEMERKARAALEELQRRRREKEEREDSKGRKTELRRRGAGSRPNKERGRRGG